MKVCLVYENRVRPDTTGNYFLWGFQRLGAEVVHFHPDKLDEIPTGLDFYLKVDDGIKQYNDWREALQPSAYYCIDTHYDDAAEWRPGVAAQFPQVFTAQKNGIDFFRTHGVTNPPTQVRWVPLGADEDLHSPDEVNRDHDWGFVGNLSHNEKRLDYLDTMLKAYPNALISDYSTFKEMAAIYGRCKVVFNISYDNDINMRFWEGLCSGATLVTENVTENGQEDLSDIPFYTYEDIDEAVDTVGRILELGGEQSGREHVLAAHKYSDRCMQILMGCGLLGESYATS